MTIDELENEKKIQKDLWLIKTFWIQFLVANASKMYIIYTKFNQIDIKK